MYPKPYLNYLFHFFCTRDYFECHEIMEEYWKSVGKKRDVWLALIQLAVSLYHHRRGNFSGSVKMLDSCYTLCRNISFSETGIDQQGFLVLLREKLEEMKRGEAYRPFHIPFSDPSLLKEIYLHCARLSIDPDQMEREEMIINKHRFQKKKKGGG
ncbi:conserved hypothetical protein [[Clostridium] ultunense Esp]|uniref:DUF309 domain-containing protein n=1 Tax=Thermicanus aegyptius TaxID=94009 RepID=UPI0002B70778|nr:DUF309 domain-containing protein [Thermicanus aegyptius]CCQ92887.1 conserved hypothetical protein [[Clostridium] ultunense Esp]